MQSPQVYQRTSAELRGALVRQVGHLRRSMQLFDQGHPEEAERLATAAYILFYDGKGKSRSLLGRLGLLDTMELPDTQWACRNITGLPLAKACLEDGEIVFRPNLEEAARNRLSTPWKPFPQWWDGDRLFWSPTGHDRRKHLVRALRDQDGGGHVDAELKNRGYVLLRDFGVAGLSIVDGKIVKSIRHEHGHVKRSEPTFVQVAKYAHWSSMRQMAYEIDEALKVLRY